MPAIKSKVVGYLQKITDNSPRRYAKHQINGENNITRERIIAVSPFAETSYISTLGQQAFRSIPKMFPLTLQPDY